MQVTWLGMLTALGQDFLLIRAHRGNCGAYACLERKGCAEDSAGAGEAGEEVQVGFHRDGLCAERGHGMNPDQLGNVQMRSNSTAM